MNDPSRPAAPTPESEPSSNTNDHLRGFCECFNSGRFYEAHDVLEEMWLPVRRTHTGELWKGLIQLAAAFVHIQHDRKGPALILLRSARGRIQQFDASACPIDLLSAIAIADTWQERIAQAAEGDLPRALTLAPPRLPGPDEPRPS